MAVLHEAGDPDEIDKEEASLSADEFISGVASNVTGAFSFSSFRSHTFVFLPSKWHKYEDSE